MRILFLNPIGQVGGAERVLLALLAGMRQASPGVELHLLLLADGPLSSMARDLGAEVTILAAPRAVTTFGDAAASTTKPLLLFRAIRAAPGAFKLARALRRQ